MDFASIVGGLASRARGPNSRPSTLPMTGRQASNAPGRTQGGEFWCTERLGSLLAVLALFVAAGVAGVQPSQDAATLELRLVPSLDSAASTPAEVVFAVLHPASREELVTYVVETDAALGGLEILVPELPTGWIVRAQAPGYWSPSVYVPPQQAAADVGLVRAGQVTLHVLSSDVEVDRWEPSDLYIVGRIWRPGRHLKAGFYRGPCRRATPDGAGFGPRDILVVCPFALGEKASLSVRLGGLVPWDALSLTVEEDHFVTVEDPARGASVSGRFPDAPERLLALDPGDGGFPFVTWTDTEGSFLLEGLGTGDYELSLAGSPNQSWPVQVAALGDEVALGALLSSEENRFSLEIWTGASRVSDFSDALVVTARAAVLNDFGGIQRLGASFNASRTDAGLFVWNGLPAGHYELRVGDREGNRWREEVVQLFGNDHLQMELEAVPVEGRARRGDKPLVDAMLWFGGLWGTERMAFRTDSLGEFSGLLPRDGEWSVDLTSAPSCDPCEGAWDEGGWSGFDSRTVSDAGWVEIVADEDGVARPLIDLPEGSVSGHVLRVVDGESQGVAAAEVVVRRLARPRVKGDYADPSDWEVRAGTDGGYSVSGLPSGQFDIVAEVRIEDRLYRSKPTRFALDGVDQMDDLDIRLAPLEPVRVVVTSSGVPVRGGFVSVKSGAFIEGGSPFTGDREYWFPSPVSLVDVVVWSDGFGAVAQRWDVSDGGDVRVELETVRGDLRLRKRLDGRLVTASGAAIDIGRLRADMGRAVAETGGDMVLIGLAPGRYRWCPSPAEECSPVDVYPGMLNKMEE